VRRLSNRRVDPQTGIYFNLEVAPPKDESTAQRLIELNEDKESVVRQRFGIWNSQVSNIEEAFKNMTLNIQSDKSVEQITELIADAIQNPIF
jgi:adenylate kinase